MNDEEEKQLLLQVAEADRKVIPTETTNRLQCSSVELMNGL